LCPVFFIIPFSISAEAKTHYGKNQRFTKIALRAKYRPAIVAVYGETKRPSDQIIRDLVFTDDQYVQFMNLFFKTS